MDDGFIDDVAAEPELTLEEKALAAAELAAPGRATPGLRSRADDVIDAVAGRPYGRPKAHTCPCGSVEFRRIQPFGSNQVSLRCAKCRMTIPWSTGSRESAVATTPSPSGPYVGEGRPAPDPTQPTFKRKSRSR